MKIQLIGNYLILKFNTYKPTKIKIYIFLILIFFSIYYIYKTTNLIRFLDTELQHFQSKFTTFSSPKQLIDNGLTITNISNHQKIFIIIKNLPNIFINSFLIGEQKKSIDEINLLIKFKNLEKIYDDQKKANLYGINFNPSEVPCKVSYKKKIFDCKVKLKGDLADHWGSTRRMSLKIKLKNGYIKGMSEFSIQKPRTRQFPYDHIFHKFVNNLGLYGNNNQHYFAVSVNEQKWGVMNIEEGLNNIYLERNNLKRSGIYRISNQEIWRYNITENPYKGYFLSDPTIFFELKGKDTLINNNLLMKEQYSYIQKHLFDRNPDIFDRKKMKRALVAALIWGDLHTLFNNNSWYTFNPYSLKLEPILTDQGNWNLLDKSNYESLFKNIPYEYKILFSKSNFKKTEFLNELQYIKNQTNNFSVLNEINFLKKKYFPDDRLFSNSPIEKNINFLIQYSNQILNLINQSDYIENINQKYFISDKQIKNIDHFIHFFIYENDKVKIFNLLDVPVNITQIKLKDKIIKTNYFIEPSSKHNISYINLDLDTSDKFLEITSVYNGHERILKNNIYITNLKDKPYIINDNCKYPNQINCILEGDIEFYEDTIFEKHVEIKPGTTIFLEEDVNIIFNNGLNAKGNSDDKINFIGNNSGGILIFNKSLDSKSKLYNTIIQGLSSSNSQLYRYTGAVNGYGGEFIIKNLLLKDNFAEDQLNLVHSKLNISNLTIHNSRSDAFDCDFCYGEINELNINDAKGDGIDVSGSYLDIEKINIQGIGDKAFSVGENSDINLNYGILNKVATGIAVKDGSNLKIIDLVLKNIKFDGLMTYTKKNFYAIFGQPSLIVNDLDYDQTGNLCIREKNSSLLMNDKDCDVNKINVDSLYENRMKKINFE